MLYYIVDNIKINYIKIYTYKRGDGEQYILFFDFKYIYFPLYRTINMN